MLGAWRAVGPERNEAALGGCSEIPIFSWMPSSLDFFCSVFFETPRKPKNALLVRLWDLLGSAAAPVFVSPTEVPIGRGMWNVECPAELGNALRAVATALHAKLEDGRRSGNTSCAEFT